MKYTILINQANVVAHGLHKKTDLIDWAILDYVFSMQSITPFSTYQGFVSISIDRFNDDMPMVNTSIEDLEARVKKLVEIELLEVRVIKGQGENLAVFSTSEIYWNIAIGDNQ